MSKSKSIAIVTGGGGFLGSHTVEHLLATNHKVRVLDLPQANIEANLASCLGHPDLEIRRGDINQIPRDDDFYSGAESLFHCSAISDHVATQDNPELLIQANVTSTIRILEAARHSRIKKVIYPSSAAVYGTATWPTAESHPTQPGNAYGVSKEMAEIACRRWFDVYGVPTVCFRIFNGYGTRAATSGVVGAFLKRLLKGDPITILGDGSALRDFIYVSDIVNAFVKGAKHGKPGEVYNLGSGTTRTVKDLAELIGGKIEYGPARAGEPPVIFADIAKAKRDLDWLPTVTLEEGIRKVLESLDIRVTNRPPAE